MRCRIDYVSSRQVIIRGGGGGGNFQRIGGRRSLGRKDITVGYGGHYKRILEGGCRSTLRDRVLRSMIV